MANFKNPVVRRVTHRDFVLNAIPNAAVDHLESRLDAYFIIVGVPGNPRAYLSPICKTPLVAWKEAAERLGYRKGMPA